MDEPRSSRRRHTRVAAGAAILISTALLVCPVASADTFDPPRCISFPLPQGPAYAVDLDEDGFAEVCVTQQTPFDPFHSPSAYLYLYHATGLWTFDPPISYPMSTYPTTTLAGDLNHDGDLDVVTGTPVYNSVGFWAAVGQGLNPVSSAASHGNPKVLVDLDGDTQLDIVSADLGVVTVTKGMGGYGFAAPVSYTVTSPGGALIPDVTVGDVTGDGLLDLIAASGSTGVVRVFPQGPGGSFSALSPDLSLGGTVRAVAVGRLDSDDVLDLAVARDGVGIAVFKGNGDGTFAGRVDYPSSPSRYDVVIGGLDGDVFDDVAAISSTGNVTLWHGVGDGTLQNPEPYTLGGGYQLQIVDVNNDGRLDLVGSSENRACVLVRSQGPALDVPAESEPAFRLAVDGPIPGIGSARLRFSLPARADVRLAVYDLAGRSIAQLVNDVLPVGEHTVTWNARGTGRSGVFFAQLQVGPNRLAKRIIVLE